MSGEVKQTAPLSEQIDYSTDLDTVNNSISNKLQSILESHPGFSLPQISATDIRARLSLGFGQPPIQENYFPSVSLNWFYLGAKFKYSFIHLFIYLLVSGHRPVHIGIGRSAQFSLERDKEQRD